MGYLTTYALAAVSTKQPTESGSALDNPSGEKTSAALQTHPQGPQRSQRQYLQSHVMLLSVDLPCRPFKVATDAVAVTSEGTPGLVSRSQNLDKK